MVIVKKIKIQVWLLDTAEVKQAELCLYDNSFKNSLQNVTSNFYASKGIAV